MEDLIVLAVVGMPATGKSEVIKKLKEDFNFIHLYYGDITFDEIRRRGLEINEVNERMVREEFRASGDLGIYSRFILPKIVEAIKQGGRRILLESMYNVYEYEIIKQAFPENFKVLAIHSDADLRLKRIGGRTDRRLSIEELHSRQIAEAKKLGKGAVIALADYHYINNGHNMDVFNNDLNLLLTQKIGLTSSKAKLPKNFDSWNEIKKSVELRNRAKTKVGKVYWCRIGENVGTEEVGKGQFFKRPVLVLQKFSSETILVTPLTTKNKNGDWYFNFKDKEGNDVSAILNQTKTIDVRRLDSYMYELNDNLVETIKQKLVALINKK